MIAAYHVCSEITPTFNFRWSSAKSHKSERFQVLAMKICAACCAELPQSSFSKKQWQMKQYRRRCKACIDADRLVQALMPAKKDQSGEQQNQPKPRAADVVTEGDGDGPKCWFCNL